MADLPEGVVNPVAAGDGVGGDLGILRLADLRLYIDEQGRLVVMLSDRTSLDIFIPGSFSREQVQVVADSSRGVTIRVRKTR